MTAKEYVQWRIDTGDRFLVNLHKDDRDLLASILEQYAALRQPPVSGALQDRLFELANDFAVAKQGEVAVKLHSIYNGLQ